MIRWYVDNRRSHGGRRPQPNGRRGWRSCWAGSHAGLAEWSRVGGILAVPVPGAVFR
jgi:hypothetical protein